jgi:ankyrin repeat protein
LDLKDPQGNTLLIIAAWNRHPETVSYLLKTTSDAMNKYNAWKDTSPMSEAAKNLSPLTIKNLLAAGADPYH